MFRLPDARAAMKARFKSLGADLGPYSYGSNSCVRCCVSPCEREQNHCHGPEDGEDDGA